MKGVLTPGGKDAEEEEGEEKELIDKQGGVLILQGHVKEVHAVVWCPRKEGDSSPRLLAS
jgi:hypothetical protein